MKKLAVTTFGILFVVGAALSGPALSDDHKSEATKAAPSADEQVAGLEAMCAASGEARTKRHAEKSLFKRLGGQKKIHALTKEVVRLHHENDAIEYLLDGIDDDDLARKVADFIVAGTGGPQVYEGRALPESHAHLKLTNAHFMAAGGDVIQGMKNLGYGENEINEMVCIFVSLRPQVVLEKAKAE